MNRDRLIRATTIVAVVSMVLLLYWVFAVGCITVFGLRVFRENVTQAFGFSILGILALLAGSLIVNVVLNLSKISDSLSPDVNAPASPPNGFPSGMHTALLLAAFPILAGGLFLGDLATTKNRERFLIGAARSVLQGHRKEIATLAEYSFSKEYIDRAGQVLAVLSRTNESYPQVQAIVEDTTEDPPLILGFGGYHLWEDSKDRKRTAFIYSCSAEEQAYLRSVFAGRERNHRFSASDGSYELYFPVVERGRTIVIYFSDRREYGKLGS